MSSNQKIVRVAVPRPLWSLYDYVVDESHRSVTVGARVLVPFHVGVVVAMVVELSDKSDHKGQLKSVAKVIDDQAILPPDLLKLALWLSSYYHCPLGTVYENMLPNEVRRGRTLEFKPEYVWKAVRPKPKPEFGRAVLQERAWKQLCKEGEQTDSQLRAFRVDRKVLKALEKKGLAESEVQLPNYKYLPPKFRLTKDQKIATESIVSQLNQFGVQVLDGVTGSGKTEVYIRVIHEVLSRGLQVLILVPEIALTPQTAEQFRSRFGHVAVVHSMRTKVQRFDVWFRVATGEFRVVLGTRSAVFTPFKNLGLIVVDEEHDSSYKQSDTLRYSARDAALVRAKYLNVPCILGSATPSLETLENIRRQRYLVSKLTHRPGTAEMPTFRLLDIRGQTLQGGMSAQLIELARNQLNDKGQVLILINRRGYAPSLICTSCGWQARCQDCDVALTLHEHPNRELQCHYCERRYPIPASCTQCSAETLQSVGAATQRTEETLQTLFPDVPVRRVDRDSISSNRQLNQLFDEIRKPGARILVGTQILAKGHHLPNVTMVGVIGADAGFMSADFRAAERTAQLIVQVAGRAGRAKRRGEVWIQTYDPEHPHLSSLAQSGYHGFAESELLLRKSASFPPYSHLALLRAEGENADQTEQFLVNVTENVDSDEIVKLGPAPAPLTRLSGRWRYQAALLSPNRMMVHRELKKIEKAPIPRGSKIRWSIDVDPIEML